MPPKIQLSAPQYLFLDPVHGLDTKFRAYVGGFGSGKTFVGCLDLLNFFGKHPKTTQGYFGVSYSSIRDIFYPTFSEAAELLGFTIKIKYGDKEIDVYRNGKWYGKIICRSMDNPNSIIGFKIARALVDEIDTLPKDKANLAWTKIIARMRLKIEGIVNSIGVTTTPEGFLFVYDKFANEPTESYSMVQASTYENEQYLPDDYIESLLETYPESLVNAYVNGLFVNLKSGTVFSSYNRIKNRSTETIKAKEPLRIGMDFNVTNMSAVVYVMRGYQWHAVDEFKSIYDTPAMIEAIKERYSIINTKGERELQHNIKVYPDATGKNRKSVNASTSDIALLEDAKFIIYANPSNPLVKDRVLATNSAFDKNLLLINDTKCPEYAKCMEQLSYDKNGVPDKTSNLDHLPDAGTYPIAFELPIVKPVANINIQFAR